MMRSTLSLPFVVTLALLATLASSAPISEEQTDRSSIENEATTILSIDEEPAAVALSSIIVSVSSTTETAAAIEILTSTLRSNSEKSKSLDLENIQLSPKLGALYKRLSSLDPDTLRSGVVKFRQLLSESKTRDEFLSNLWKESDNVDPAELAQFKSDLEELATFIEEKHPNVLNWFLSTVGGGRLETTNEKLTFLEKFSEIDDQLSEYPIWNRYWGYWFRSSGDFIAKHG